VTRWTYIHVGPLRKLPESGFESEAGAELPVLIEALLAFSPEVSLALSTPFPKRGLWIEVGRSAHIFGGEAELLDRILTCARQLGFSASAALADRPESAYLLTFFESPAPILVPPGRDAELLAPLPVAVLNPSVKAQKFFKGLGIRRLEELARLSPSSLSQRIGPEGATLVRLARADDFPPPILYSPPEHPVARLELDPPIPPEEGLIFVLKRLLVDLTARVRGRGCAVMSLEVEIQTSGGCIYNEAITLPRPLNSDGALLSIIRLRLSDILKPDDPYLIPEQHWIDAVAIKFTGLCHAQGSQAGFFERSEQNYEALAELLGRLSVHLGEEQAVGVQLQATHRPEASWAPTDFLLDHKGRDPAHEKREEPPDRPTFLLPTPLPVEGALHEGSLLRWAGGRGRISSFWGPERLRGEWWHKPFARDYFVTATEEGARLWVYRDLYTRKIYLHGIFD
jgi:protein ImuB